MHVYTVQFELETNCKKKHKNLNEAKFARKTPIYDLSSVLPFDNLTKTRDSMYFNILF